MLKSKNGGKRSDSMRTEDRSVLQEHGNRLDGIPMDPEERGEWIKHSMGNCPYCPKDDLNMTLYRHGARRTSSFNGGGIFCKHVILVADWLENAGPNSPEFSMHLHDSFNHLKDGLIGGQYVQALAIEVNQNARPQPKNRHRIIETELYAGQSPGGTGARFIILRSWVVFAESTDDFIREAIDLARRQQAASPRSSTGGFGQKALAGRQSSPHTRTAKTPKETEL